MSVRIPPAVAAEIDNFEAEMNRFLSGDLAEERFRAFRLAQGIYGQRQDGEQMVRIKIPSGVLNASQLERIATVAEEFGSGVSHLTTRQDVQFHYVKLRRVPGMMRSLAEVGLTTREACGNSVRNVTACPVSGFIADEAFDVRPYSLATYEFLVRNPLCQQLARKFKVAFSACPEDCVATAIHDIGALGRVRREGLRTRYGFKLVVGGGLGAAPFVAQTLEEFVPVEDLLTTIKAILEVASHRADRVHRMRARLKFAVHKIGIETFRELVAKEKSALTSREREEADPRRFVPESFASVLAWHLSGRPRPEDRLPAAVQASGDTAFDRWSAFSVRAHKQPDRAVVTVMVPLGDLQAPVLRGLTALVRAYGEDHARIAIDQNLVLPNVRRADLRSLHDGLRDLGLADAGAGTALDVTSCPGADTCNLGITSSKGLTRAIRSRLLPMADNGGMASLRGVSIKISGCPNSCGQHHVAGIGLHGVARRTGSRQLPAYQLHLGGRISQEGTRIGQATFKIPARSAPDAIAALLERFHGEREEAESFPDYVDRIPRSDLEATLHPFLDDDALTEESYIDWGQTSPYSTDEMGVGECAGAGTDVSAGPFDEYGAETLQASLFMRRGQWVDALANLNRSQYTIARVLLKVLQKSPESDYEVECAMRAHVIDRGHASELWNEYHERIESLLRTRRPDPSSIEQLHRMSRSLLEESRNTYVRLSRVKATRGPVEIPA